MVHKDHLDLKVTKDKKAHLVAREVQDQEEMEDRKARKEKQEATEHQVLQVV